MRPLLCFEELEVEKLKQQETQAKAQGPEAEEAHEEQAVTKAVDELDSAKEEEDATDDMGGDSEDGTGDSIDSEDPSSDDSADPTESPDSSSTDESADPPAEDDEVEDPPKDDDSKSKGDDLKEAKESFANFGQVIAVSLEDYQDYETGAEVGELALHGVKAGYEAAAWVGKSLWSLGVEYGPGIVTAVFKGVLYTMARLGQGLGAMYDTLAKAAAKRKASISVLSKEISDLKDAIEKIKSTKNDPTEKDANEGGVALYNKVDTIDSFKIGDQASPTKSLAVLNKYLTKTIVTMAQAAVDDLNGLKRMTQVIGSPTDQDITSALSVSLDRSGYKHGSLVEEKLDSYAVEELYYPETLPGDMILRLVLPVSKLRDPEEYEKAFEKSSLELHFNKGNYRSVQNVPVLTLAQIEGLIKPLEETLTTLKKQEGLYEQIERTKPGVMNTAKNHLLAVARSKAKVPLDKSMAEPLYLKAKFVSSVYLTGLTESHIYSARVLSSIIAYCHYSLLHLR